MMKLVIISNTHQTPLLHSPVIMDILCMDITQHTVQYQTQGIGLKKHQIAGVITLNRTILLSGSTYKGYQFSDFCRIHNFLHIFVVTCLALTLSNGAINYDEDPADDGRYLVTTIATFTCNDDYYLDGDLTATCESSGNWNQQPMCRGIQN